MNCKDCGRPQHEGACSQQLISRASDLLSIGFAAGMNEFQNRVAQWNKFNFPEKVEMKYWDQPFMGMVEELGELSHSLLKAKQGIRGTLKEHEFAGMDAVGDFMVYLADFCTMKGWNLGSCMVMAWNQIKDRDWKRFPKNGKSE